MLDFKLTDKYNVITCLFGSINYMMKKEDLLQVTKTMASHLLPGGILILEPFITKDQYKAGSTFARFVDKPDLKIARMHINKREGDVAIWDLYHLLIQNGAIQHFIEKHRLGLYLKEDYVEAITSSNLELQFYENSFLAGNLSPLIVALKTH